MNLHLRPVLDDLRHARQVMAGYQHLTRLTRSYVTADPAVVDLGLRAGWIADEADLLRWHLERSRTARAVLPRAAAELRADAAYWRASATRKEARP